MATALQLVNRVRRLHRFGDAANLSDNLSVGLLDRVNNALETVFEERTWQFQIHNDGFINTTPLIESTTGEFVSVTSRSTNFAMSGSPLNFIDTDPSPFGDDRLMELVLLSNFITGGEVPFSGTSFLVDNGNLNSSADTMNGVFFEPWPGQTGLATYQFFVRQYILPTTVRSVLSVKHQEQPVQLFFSEEFLDYDRTFPRPWDDTGDPDFVIVGGWSKSSRDTAFTGGAGGALPQVEGIKMIVHPVPPAPDAGAAGGQVINYSYIFREPTLTAPDDETSIIPESILSVVVDLAYARSLQGGIGNDPTTGFTMERRVLQDVVRKYAAQKADSYLTNSVRSRDDIRRSRVAIGRLPRVVEGL